MYQAGVLQRIADAARASRAELGLVVLLGLAIVGAGAVVVLRSTDAPAPEIEQIAAPDAAAAESPAPAPPAPMLVHVAGQVADPGVYELEEGSRVVDAIEAAGGALEEADIDAVNLAAVIADGQKIVLPRPGEALPADAAGTGVSGAQAGGKINLNTAGAAQLEELPGVGPVLSQRIVDHRTSKGPFTSPRQLMEVSGFGTKKYEALKDLITV